MKNYKKKFRKLQKIKIMYGRACTYEKKIVPLHAFCVAMVKWMN